ncbi:MAG: FAD-dependent oxidoreductase [Phycisphaerales bacterium]|nr:FAD-dependent oxidoreductase [Phycisphaerales bacterium]
MTKEILPMDCVIFGGGVAGLFILHKCLALGHRAVLLESKSLGTGQTIDSQGIIHGGLKYAITGHSDNSATTIREMPLVWRRCLAGEATPDLTNVVLRSDYCHVWRTDSIRSKLGWIAAKLALRTKPKLLDQDELPEAFQGLQGPVARLDEQVVEPRSLLEVLSHELDTNLMQTVEGGVEVSKLDEGWLVQLLHPDTGEPLDLHAKKVVLSAGKGNVQLRDEFNLTPNKTQDRPLHMVIVRGELPVINGHCIDGAKTRVTITTTKDYAGRSVWQVGGQLAEDGVNKSPEELMSFAAKELQAVLPNVNLDHAECITYKTTRAEQHMRGIRPTDISIIEENDVLTCWPTKLAFAPRLADEVVARMDPPSINDSTELSIFSSWPSPTVALSPWETDQTWSPIELTCSL